MHEDDVVVGDIIKLIEGMVLYIRDKYLFHPRKFLPMESSLNLLRSSSTRAQ